MGQEVQVLGLMIRPKNFKRYIPSTKYEDAGSHGDF